MDNIDKSENIQKDIREQSEEKSKKEILAEANGLSDKCKILMG
jgi:hypothetical protein